MRRLKSKSECQLVSPKFRSDIGVKQGCPLSPTLFGLYIDKLEEWLNSQEGDGALLGDFVIRLLLYADDLILIAKSALRLQEHLISLEHFCSTVGMQVNTSKTKVVVFSSKRKQKHNQHKFYFEGNTLDEVADYKYLGIDFNKNLSWEGCRKKRTLGGWKAFYAFCYPRYLGITRRSCLEAHMVLDMEYREQD